MSNLFRTHSAAFRSATTLTISSGAVTVTQTYHVIAAETSTTDDLDTISLGYDATTINSISYRPIVILHADAGDTITVKHNTDNIQLSTNADVVLSGNDTLLLIYDGTNWNDITGGMAGSGLTSPVAISDGGTGQSSQTAGFDALAPTTSKGDIIASNGSDNVRLAVGAGDGQTLVVDASEAAGIKYGDHGDIAGLSDDDHTQYALLAGRADDKQVFPDSATTAPLNLAERSTAPSSPAAGDIYLDDGSNTASGQVGFRHYTGAAWEDVVAGAGSGYSTLENDGSAVTQRVTADFRGFNLTDDSGNTQTIIERVEAKNLINDGQRLAGSFEVWINGTSSAPYLWTLAGASGTIARSATHKHGDYSAAVTRSGTNVTLTYEAWNDAGQEYIQDRTFVLGAWVQTDSASVARLQLDDGVATAESSYHGGGGGWEWLTVQITANSSASKLDVVLQTNSSDTTAYFDAVCLVEGNNLHNYIPSSGTALPRTWSATHEAGSVTIDSGNAIVDTQIGTVFDARYSYQNASAINDAWHHDFWLAAGSYALNILFSYYSASSGILTIYIDDVSQGTVDTYVTPSVSSQKSSTNITVIGDGYHRFAGVVATKNGSSTGYNMYCTRYWIL